MKKSLKFLNINGLLTYFLLLFFSLSNHYVFSAPLISVEYESNVSILVADSNNNIIYQHNKDIPRLIASNMKLFTTLIGLNQLGPDYHWHTKLYYNGTISNKILNGNLYLVGGGDPTLDLKAIYQIIAKLKDLGIHRINGNLIFDDQLFKTKPTYSMLKYQDYDSDTVLPNGILINGNLSHLYIAKGKKSGRFKVTSDLYKFIIINKLQVDNQEQQCQQVYDNLKLELVGNSLTISGKIGRKCDNLDLSFNLLPPFAYNKNKIQQALNYLNIKFNGKYLHGVAPANSQLIYDYSSESLEAILIKMNHFSDNLIAETVLLTSGTLTFPNIDNYAAEQKLFNEFIAHNSLTNPKAKLENGAGLSRYEYFTSQNLVNLLTIANSGVQQASFEASLAVPGKEGTLKNALLSFGNRIHAKTGTLNDTKSLSGYYYSTSGKKYIFSIIANNFDTTKPENIQLFNKWVEETLNNLN